VCDSVESALAEAEVDFYYLIGAQARDLWFARNTHRTPATKDVDFAIMVGSSEQFLRVKEILSQRHGFEELHDDSMRLRSPDGTTVDILPFGSSHDDDLILGGHGLTSIHVDGFKEVANAGTVTVQFDKAGREAFRLATLPAIVLLKLISYNDRPEHRAKDPQDIALIIQTYFDVATQHFFDVHHDVLDDIDRGVERMNARVIGREVRAIVAENDSLEKRLNDILAKHIAGGVNSKFVEIVARQMGVPLEYAVEILLEMDKGLFEQL